MANTIALSIDEIFLLGKQKMAQLGFEKFVIKHRTIKLPFNSQTVINASSEYWFLKQEIFGIDISSSYGISGEQRVNFNELVNIHNGRIVINNNTIYDSVIEFMQILPLRIK